MKKIYLKIFQKREFFFDLGSRFLDGFLRADHKFLLSHSKRQRLRIYNGLTVFLIINILLYIIFHLKSDINLIITFSYFSIVIISYIINLSYSFEYFEATLLFLILTGIIINTYQLFSNFIIPPLNLLSFISIIVILHFTYSRKVSLIYIILLIFVYLSLILIKFADGIQSHQKELMLQYFNDLVFNSLLLWFLLEIYGHFREELELKLKEVNITREKDLELAREIQIQLYPPKIQSMNFQIDYFIEPLDKVSGDLIEIIEKKENYFLIFGDVTGHGIQSGMLTMQINTLVNYLIIDKEIEDIFEIYFELNNHYHQILKKLEIKNFAVLTILKIHKNGLIYAIGSLNNIYHFDSNLNLIETFQHNQTLGMLPLKSKDEILYTKIQLKKGDFLFICTDGLYEIPTTDNEILKYEQFITLLKKYFKLQKINNKELSLSELTTFLKKELKILNFNDDASAIMIRKIN
ncbi:MAG: serine/threonine-protein phosphatase [Leptospiraceae bacterium]|nr:serine/threonine-protein phosphatase [Leptospiraceae bacterium]MDW7976299.1 SpoIIE family protein phosphatase [Leptospiraceae bacterium]